MRNRRWDELLSFENDKIDTDFITSILKHQNRIKKRWNNDLALPQRRRATVGSTIVGTPPDD
ncbi:hypothetical protein LLE49_12785 [Alicyclobacillus tolerans]|uniref:hypothetical protein n=1 Tax=Alicyclobacillus tolerans TaxID=90970 RepID=UPI001F1AFBF8|nr:hypothetical protein [Alicyclobacillus tolerans]MCF8565594.1 hypothetical protein [Alicyclobacillus tolerans]